MLIKFAAESGFHHKGRVWHLINLRHVVYALVLQRRMELIVLRLTVLECLHLTLNDCSRLSFLDVRN